jgi:hypothetical protein
MFSRFFSFFVAQPSRFGLLYQEKSGPPDVHNEHTLHARHLHFWHGPLFETLPRLLNLDLSCIILLRKNMLTLHMCCRLLHRSPNPVLNLRILTRARLSDFKTSDIENNTQINNINKSKICHRPVPDVQLPCANRFN